VYFGVCEKFGVKLISRCFANALGNFFIVEQVFFRNDLDVCFFGAG
jgi:hypothetical protein